MAGCDRIGLNRRFGVFTDVFKLDGQFKDFTLATIEHLQNLNLSFRKVSFS